VAFHEMRLLHVSITEDGYTQPIVAIFDQESHGGEGRYIIVDGFHRYSVMRRFEEVHQKRHGYLPVVVLDKSIADRMASTVRHNRARGKHSVAGMGSLVFQMLREGVSDVDICNKIGLEAEELARLKHVTGYSKLYKDAEYSRPVLITPQLQAKAAYKKEHPDEYVPTNF
jgi:ParB-like chromosome segregation protein Spo0J